DLQDRRRAHGARRGSDAGFDGGVSAGGVARASALTEIAPRQPRMEPDRMEPDYLASWNSGEGTQPSLPSSSLTFHQILSFSPVGYSVVPGSRSRITLDLLLAFSYNLPGLAMVTDCWTLSVLAS